MKIAIIGSGNVGTALGKRWLQAGHEVSFGVRDPGSVKAQRLKESIKDPVIRSIPDAAGTAEVIVITTPPDAISGIIPALGDVQGKTIIDTTNAIRIRPEPYPTVFHAIKGITGAEHIVKCFNSTGFENMADPVYDASILSNPTGIDMFMAGAGTQAKVVASQLALDAGFDNCYDFGGEDKVILLEQFALCWINLAIMQGMGRNIALKVLRRKQA